MSLPEGYRLLTAEAAVRDDRPARPARQHDAGDGVIEVQVAARDAVDVRGRHPLDTLEILVRRGEAVERERLGPHRGELGDVVALKLCGAALLELRRLDELRRHPFAGDAGEDGARVVLERLRIRAGGEGQHGVGKARLGQRIERELRTERFALGHEAVEIETATAEHVREHLEGCEVGVARTRRAQRNHERAARAVGVERE